MAAGSASTSGVASWADTSSYWRASSSSLASRPWSSVIGGRHPGLSRAAAGPRTRADGVGLDGRRAACAVDAAGPWPGPRRARRRRGRPRRSRRAAASGRAARSRLPAGTSEPSARIASSMATIATSIMSSVGCLVVIFWTRMPGPHDHPDDRVGAVPGAQPQQLVAHRGDHRDEQDPARDHDQRRLAADEAEHEDRQQDHDHQELGAAARVGGRVLADVSRGRAGRRARARGSSCARRRGTGTRA